MADYLDTYSGRDKMLKVLSYTTKLLTASTSSKNAQKKLKDIGSEMSEGRMLLRLLDDFSALRSVMKYGWGKEVRTDICIYEYRILDKNYICKMVAINHEMIDSYY